MRSAAQAFLKRFRTLTTHAPGFLDGSLAKPDLTVTSPGEWRKKRGTEPF